MCKFSCCGEDEELDPQSGESCNYSIDYYITIPNYNFILSYDCRYHQLSLTLSIKYLDKSIFKAALFVFLSTLELRIEKRLNSSEILRHKFVIANM